MWFSYSQLLPSSFRILCLLVIYCSFLLCVYLEACLPALSGSRPAAHVAGQETATDTLFAPAPERDRSFYLSIYLSTWKPSLEVGFLWSFIKAGNNQCRFILWSLIIVHQSKQHKPNVVVKSRNWFCTFVNSSYQKSKKND